MNEAPRPEFPKEIALYYQEVARICWRWAPRSDDVQAGDIRAQWEGAASGWASWEATVTTWMMPLSNDQGDRQSEKRSHDDVEYLPSARVVEGMLNRRAEGQPQQAARQRGQEEEAAE